VLIIKGVKVVCFDTLLQVLISKAVSSRQFTVDSFKKTLRKAGTGLGTEVAQEGTPPRVFWKKRLDLLDSKGVDFFRDGPFEAQDEKEAASC
jgi:hypothetical protein